MTIFLITGSSSSKQKDRIDDGRGSKAHDFAHEAAILRTLSSDSGENSENSLHVEADVATIFVKTRIVGLWAMSHVVQEANLSCSTGKYGQSVRRSSTRSRKPNSSLDQEAVGMERIPELRKRRGEVLSALTVKRKEIDTLLTDENNFEAVKVKLTKIMWETVLS